jgi:PIN domain nuclease of toxin-antitoxin system
MVYVLDTHAVVWFLEGSSRLGAAAKIVMSDPNSDLVVPTIVLVEAWFLYSKKRTSVDVEAVQQTLVAAANCVAYPLDEQVVSMIPTSLNIHDAIIVATALVYKDILSRPVEIVSKDIEIKASGLVSTCW